ncbi:MAG TPA: SH3 domain-containing protein [Thermohalobaculum sp.]|nr:SH3 domain-containing protein [Thermohalobaculum sp.]
MAGFCAVIALGAALALSAGPAGAQTGAREEAQQGAQQGAQEGAQEPRVATVGPVTKLPLPRYVSLRSEKVNARRGPGLDYRIDWVFQRAGLPVRVIDEHGHWRHIVDSDDAGGWVYHALITARRTALITAATVGFRAEPAETAPPTAEAERGVVATLIRCRPDWCELEAKGVSGWVPKAAIWGVDPEETFGGERRLGGS